MNNNSVSQYVTYGSGILTLYLALSFYFVYNLERVLSILIASSTTLVVVFLIKENSKLLLETIAGSKLRDVFVDLADEGFPEDDFYHGNSSDAQAKLDEIDRKSFHRLIDITATSIIAITLPIFAYFEFGLNAKAVVPALAIGLILLYIFPLNMKSDIQRHLEQYAKVIKTDD